MTRLSELRDFVRTVDPALQRLFPFQVDEVRDSGAGGGVYTVKGHAAVYNKWSLDLGGFRERIKTGAFDDVLSSDPHVMHLWDHDTARSLSSTRSKDYPLELRSDPQGLRFYSKVAPTSYAADLRVLLEGGVIDQSSFAFTVAQDEWKIRELDGQEIVERTILQVDQLFDVTTCAMGAYPTTDSALAVRNLSLGRRRTAGAEPTDAPNPASEQDDVVGTQDAAPDEPVDAQTPPEHGGDPAPPTDELSAEERQREHDRWKSERAAEYRRTREFAFGVNHNQQENK